MLRNDSVTRRTRCVELRSCEPRRRCKYPPFCRCFDDRTRMQQAAEPSAINVHQSGFSQIGHGFDGETRIHLLMDAPPVVRLRNAACHNPSGRSRQYRFHAIERNARAEPVQAAGRNSEASSTVGLRLPVVPPLPSRSRVGLPRSILQIRAGACHARRTATACSYTTTIRGKPGFHA